MRVTKMTKKDELINFVTKELDDTTNVLRLKTDFVGLDAGSCTICIGASKPRTIEIITDNFDDELVGALPTDTKVHHITSWSTSLRF